MSLIDRERDDAFDLAHQGLRMSRLGNALLRDAMPTAAEMEAKLIAFAECLDTEADR